jgi:hypothetical protein
VELKEIVLGSFKHPHAFDPLDLEIIDRVYEAAWAQVEARDPVRSRNSHSMTDSGILSLVPVSLVPVGFWRQLAINWSAVIHPSIGWGGREPFAGMLCGEWATRPPYRLRLSSGGLGAPSPGPLRVL